MLKKLVFCKKVLASAILRRFCPKKAYFRETTHLSVYFCTKFQVSSIIQTREGSVILPSTAKWTPKKSTLIRVKLLRYFWKTSGKNLSYSLPNLSRIFYILFEIFILIRQYRSSVNGCCQFLFNTRFKRFSSGPWIKHLLLGYAKFSSKSSVISDV